MLSGKVLIDKHNLNLKMMLVGGQCFRWKEILENQWIGTVSNTVWLLSQYDDHIEYEVKGSLQSNKKSSSSHFKEKPEEFLKNYLRLGAPLTKYYDDWSRKDANFKKVSKKCYGIRILNQDPVENIFSFICSSNNNIKRISSLVEKLCKMYGPKICEVDGLAYYGFPELSALVDSEECDLRKAGFGYRAKFIHQSAKQIHEFGGMNWIEKLKSCSYVEAKNELMKLTGIGAKVADCICLMSLGHMEALPVDTHVYQIASQCYMTHLKKVKNLTDRIYNEIGDFFRDLYGPLAGWAHTVLFCGDLKLFKEGPDDLKDNHKSLPIVNGNDSDLKSAGIKRSSSKEENKTLSGILRCSQRDLNLDLTFISGQTYRFKKLEKNVWRGVFAGKVWTLRQFDEYIEYSAHYSNRVYKKLKVSGSIENGDSECCEDLLRDYFRLDVPLSDYYDRWSKSDKHFNEISQNFRGMRMIKQDIVENLFAFICSSCNTIDRMAKMVETMCTSYGEKIAEVDNVIYFDFPDVSKLSEKSVVTELSNASFGYRSKYIQQSAEYILEQGGNAWFENLKHMPYEEAKVTLMKLPGVAAKVADCICLTALDHLETIPVDTHVFQIAKRFYLPHLKDKKIVSAKSYKEIGECFRSKFGHYSGWAHTVLFCADLKQHKDLHLKGQTVYK